MHQKKTSRLAVHHATAHHANKKNATMTTEAPADATPAAAPAEAPGNDAVSSFCYACETCFRFLFLFFVFDTQ